MGFFLGGCGGTTSSQAPADTAPPHDIQSSLVDTEQPDVTSQTLDTMVTTDTPETPESDAAVDARTPPAQCLNESTYFQCAIWEPFMGSTCFACHQPGGVGAAGGEFDLLPVQDGNLSANLAQVKAMAQKQYNGQSILLLKAQGQMSHGGGVILPADSVEYQNLSHLVSYFTDASFCRSSCDDPVELIDEPDEICQLPSVTDKFDPKQPVSAPAIYTQRLTQWQYRSSVSRVLDYYMDDYSDWLPPDSSTGAIPSNESYDLPTAEYADYAKTAAFVASKIMAKKQSELDTLFACPGKKNRKCAETFITQRGARMFRRPLTPDEVNAYLDIYDIGAKGSFNEAMQYVLEALLQAPDFLYQVELGPIESVEEHRLSGLEIATRLSYFLHQQPPSQQLLDAAIAGELDDDAGVSKWAELLLSEVGLARFGIQQFIMRWLRMDAEHAVEKNPEQFPDFTSAVLKGIRRGAQLWAAYTVLEGDGQLETLFSAAQTVARLNKSENQFWEATNSDIVATSKIFGTVISLPSNERAGLLTDPTRLANAHNSDDTGTRPVLRGAALLKNVLCGTLEPPQAFEPPPAIEGESVKDKVSYMLNSPSCAKCHSVINPLGLAFEIYDGVGAYRTDKTDDAGFPIETSGSYGVDGYCSDNTATYDDAVDLIKSLATNTQLRSCATLQWFRYALRRGPRLNGSDAGNLAQIYEAFSESNFNVPTLLKAIVLSRPFLYRRFGDLEGSP